jgi:hypothetical protein
MRDNRILASGIFIQLSGFIVFISGKAFSPVEPYLPDKGYIKKEKNKEPYRANMVSKKEKG